MDPFLEFHWRDVHHALVTYARDQLQPQLPGELMARMQERVIITGGEGVIGHRSPDVHVVEYPRATGGAAAVAVAEPVSIDEPFVVELPELRLTETSIEIIDAASGNPVVATIEFLSPTNKLAGPGRDEYLRKRDEYQQAGANLVEIDLTRQGPRAAVMPLASIPTRHHATYLVCVTRARPRWRLEYYPVSIRSRLPSIRVPLRPHDPDVVLRLQPLVELAYVNGRYEHLDYRRPLVPELNREDATWVDQLLQAVSQAAARLPPDDSSSP
jgi:hypothetical protein